jgi:hypothetical protein
MKQYDDVFRQMDNVFKEVDKVFKQMDQVRIEVETKMTDPQWIEKTNAIAKWEPYISWVPRKIGKRWYWHSPIYRKYQFKPKGNFWIYGTEFDVLRDSK